MTTIGLGIVTYNRPEYFTQCYEAISQNARGVITRLYAFNDKSTVEYPKPPKDTVYIEPMRNMGVAHAKNTLLERMMSDSMEHLFIIEDDILIKDPKAITEYVRLAEEYGMYHLMFAHHGQANAGGAVYGDENIEYYAQCVGAFCYYSKALLEESKRVDEKKHLVFPGLLDENFKNAWEHVEHAQRLSHTNLTSPFGLFADITKSREYLEEIPGSIDNSSIRPDKKWLQNRLLGLKYWEQKYGEKPPVDMIVDEKEVNHGSTTK